MDGERENQALHPASQPKHALRTQPGSSQDFTENLPSRVPRFLQRYVGNATLQAVDNRINRLPGEGVQAVEIRQSVPTPSIQRTIELRPPGRGEASAFDRRQELIDRLNGQSAAVRYSLDGRELQYEVVTEADLTNFDRQMMGFIDNAQLIPLRLITSAGLVQGATGFEPLTVDAFLSGYLDLDDMLATDDVTFQSLMIHILAERFSVPNYARRIGSVASLFPGTPPSFRIFNRAHGIGHEAQAEHFQDLFSDPSIRFNFERELSPGGTVQKAWRSHAEGYRVFMTIRRRRSAVVSVEVRVRTTDQRWLSVEDFLAERAAAAAP